MAYKAGLTEHSGAKHGKGAYYGRKQNAKKESRKLRRSMAKKLINQILYRGE